MDVEVTNILLFSQLIIILMNLIILTLVVLGRPAKKIDNLLTKKLDVYV